MDNHVRIFDTTLRDGEQSPGATMNSAEKMEVARALSELGVDIIEAGFPAASLDDFNAVRQIAAAVGRSRPGLTICGLARAQKGDIDAVLTATESAERPRVHTFLATSPIHRDLKLRMSRSQIVDRVGDMVRYAHQRCEDVEFSAEDAGRTEPDFLHEVVRVAIEAGATTINIPDTVGYTQPFEFGGIISGLFEAVPEARNIIVSVHCHNDLGLAVANTLAGIRAGARQAEVAVNGIGERAGNTALEEVVMALETRRSVYQLEHRIHTERLCPISALVSRITGMEVQPNKAVVGRNAFAHEAGIHQDGMLKDHQTYEIMRPETVGAPKTELVMGKHSGRSALKARMADLGVELEGPALDQAFERFKALADRRKQVTDTDLLALFRDESEQMTGAYHIARLEVSSGHHSASAVMTISSPEGNHVQTAVGTGPVEAAFRAIDQALRTEGVLIEYRLHATGVGSDALGEASVRVRGPMGRVFRGFGSDEDVVLASAKAYLAAQNKARQAGETQTRDLSVPRAAEAPQPAVASYSRPEATQ